MRFRQLAQCLVLSCLSATTGSAHEALPHEAGITPAWILYETSRIEDFGADLHIELALSRPVRYRVFTLTDPLRLVLDFAEVDFSGGDLGALVHSDSVAGLAMGAFRPGWSRLVVELRAPMRVETAGIATALERGRAALKLQLAPTDEATFAGTAGETDAAPFVEPPPVVAPVGPDGAQALRVVIDPGHGGIDPGSQAGGLSEAAVTLIFARELRDGLVAAGIDAILTRDDDHFVPTSRRIEIARAASADLLLSIHADAPPEGRASGSTIYTFGDVASDPAAADLADRHDRAELSAGVDPGQLGAVLAGLGGGETDSASRAELLAEALVVGLARTTGDLHKRPRMRADFSVLKDPGTPSALIEIGVLSNADDRARLRNPEWRAAAILGIHRAIEEWAASGDATAHSLQQ